MAHSNLPPSFWGDAVLTSQYVRNRLPTKTLPDGKTPHEMVYGSRPDLSLLRVWGCRVFALVPPETRRKGGPAYVEGIFVGYREGTLGWRVRTVSGAYILSRSVYFDEDTPGRLKGPRSPQSSSIPDDLGSPSSFLTSFVDLLSVAELLADVSAPDVSFGYAAFFNAVTFDLTTAPQSHAEALARPDAEIWRLARQDEIDSLVAMVAFAVDVPLPDGRRVIGVMWVYAWKKNDEGERVRAKARLVVLGNNQQAEDFDETYAPVARMVSLRSILALAAAQNLELSSFDVKTAFLHGRLSKPVWIRQPPGFKFGSLPYLKLNVSLYGLRQSAYEWNKVLTAAMLSFGMVVSSHDAAVFVGSWATSPDASVPMPEDGSLLMMIVSVHVDDGLAAHNSPALYAFLVRHLRDVSKINVVDQGLASLYVGWRIIRDRPKGFIYLSQKTAILELLSTWGMTNCHARRSPMTAKQLSDLPLPPTGFDPASIRPQYQSLIGSLLYLALSTRPDIVYATIALSQHCSNPTPALFDTAKGVLRYLKGTAALSLRLGTGATSLPPSIADLGPIAVGCSDADWASDATTRRSVSGYTFYYLGSLISWSVSKQKSVSLSSTEAEYYALVHAMKEAIWLKGFWGSLAMPAPDSFPMVTDNQAAGHLASSPAVSNRSKHIDVRCHFIKLNVATGEFTINWASTDDMPADIFTKPLPAVTFLRHRDALGLHVPPGGGD